MAPKRRPSESEHSTSIDDDSVSEEESSDSEKPSSPACIKPNTKRPAVTEEHQVSKTNKSKIVDKGGSKSVASFTRVFTEKDEIVLLEGIIDYKENKGTDSSLNIADIHESVKESLSCTVTNSQIWGKIKGLKRKFMNKGKKGQIGEHESKSLKLSRKIWGSELLGKDDKDDNVGSKMLLKSVENKAETEVCWSLYPCLCASLESEAIKNVTAPMSPKEYVKKVVSGLEKEKATELELEWNAFVLMEQKVYAKRAMIISKQAEAAMNHCGAR